MKKNVLLLLLAAFLFVNAGFTQAKNTKNEEPVLPQNNYYENADFLLGNYTNSIKMLFADIDGTIIPSNPKFLGGTVPESAQQAAKALRNANIPLVLVTGRSSYEAKNIASKLGYTETYVIGQQGAVIMDGFGSIIYEDGINKKEIDTLLNEVKTFNNYYYTNVKPFLYVDEKLYTFSKVNLPYIMEQPTIIKKTKDIGENFTALKLGLYSQNPNTLRAIQRYLQLRHKNYNIVISGHCYCDISSKTATKANAINQLIEKFGINIQNVAAIGDAENDISMLRMLKDAGGLPISVGNAMPAVKEASSYVTKDVNNNGFAEAVNLIISNNKLLLP